MSFYSTYRNKKVLITGHTGFKGAWLSIWLKMLGAEVYGYALDPTQQNGIFVSSKIGDEMHDHRGDVRDAQQLNEYLQKIQPDVVFHLAAQPLVIEGYKTPVETFDINIMGTVNLLDAVRQVPTIQAVVVITTDKCYENFETVRPYKEDDPMGGHDPYSASKGAAELVVSSYRRSFFANSRTLVASVRAGNVVGGGDWSDNRIVPDAIRALREGQMIDVRNPMSIRPWQHVLDPLNGYLLLGSQLLMQKREFASAWNFGPEVEKMYTVKDVVERIIKHYGSGSWTSKELSNNLHEAGLLQLDISKAKQELNWQPILDFDLTIKYTVEWYKASESENVNKKTNEQITSFMSLWKSKKDQ